MLEQLERKILENLDKVFVQSTRGGNNSHARLFTRAVFPQYENNAEGRKVEEEDLAAKFNIDVQSGLYISFKTRKDFAKFPSVYEYVHKRGGHLVLANWDRDWLSYNDKYGNGDDALKAQPSSARDNNPIFWAIVAAAQMYYNTAI